MGRAPCCEKVGLKRGPWTPEEDQKLIAFVQENGHGSWRSLPKKAGLLRCGKSCRLRWTNYLRPDIKRGKFSVSEEQTIIQLHALLGNRWSTIASHLPKRTDNEVKNYWNTHLRKRLLRMGIDPTTHRPKSDSTSSLPESKQNFSSTLSHMAQWESARLEAEARLSRESNMKSKCSWPGGNVCSKPSSSVRTWNSQASESSFQRDLFAAKKQSSAAEDILNSFQNWQKSLQGQADLWPGNLSTSNLGGSMMGKISNSRTSPHGERMEQGSPTSTICTAKTHSETSAKAERRRLSWTDAFPHLSSSKGQMLDRGSVQAQKVRHMVSVPAEKNRQQTVTGRSKSLPFSTLDDLVFSEEDDSGPCPSSLWSQSSGDLSKDLCKSESDGTPPTLVSTSASSDILEDLRLACEDITSDLDRGRFSPDMLMDFVDESRLHSDVVALPALNADRSDVLSELMNVDESPDYWNSMLKQLMDSSNAQQIDTV